jgi:site-specific DNA recombinase
VSIEPTEAAVLRTAAESILPGGSLSQAARDASAALGRTVRPNVLRGILTRAQIAGYREYIPAADRRRGVTTGTITPATWPAVIDETTWQRLRTILLDPARRHTRPPRAYLLSGLLRCALCDAPMTGGGNAYKCSISSGGCGKTGVAIGAADRHIIDWARTTVAKPAVAKQLAKLRDAVPATGDVLSADQIDARRSTLATMFADGSISADEWRDARDRLDVHAKRAQIDNAERARLAEAARRAVDVLAAWDEATVAERRAALSALLAGRRLIVEPRGKRAGNRFDPNRIKLVPAKGGGS